jgi:hypothetical protein
MYDTSYDTSTMASLKQRRSFIALALRTVSHVLLALDPPPPVPWFFLRDHPLLRIPRPSCSTFSNRPPDPAITASPSYVHVLHSTSRGHGCSTPFPNRQSPTRASARPSSWRPGFEHRCPRSRHGGPDQAFPDSASVIWQQGASPSTNSSIPTLVPLNLSVCHLIRDATHGLGVF